MHIHILGICGTFMGGIAAIARAAGVKVTGCDANVYPPMSTQLEALGIELITGYTPEQVELKPDLFVIGNVVSRGNPLMEEILNRGLPYTSGPQWVGEHILNGKHVLAVAGTHGKTTTTSMLAWILEAAGLNPGFLIGGIPENFGVSARNTDSRLFVIEADEYDTAFFDKRSKFVHYRPTTAVLNNLEFDHADIFTDLAAIETQFHHLVRSVPGKGLVIVNAREASLDRVLARGCWSNVEHFGSDTGWSAGHADAEGANTLAPADAAGYENLRDVTRDVLDTLTPRESKVLRMRFGIGTSMNQTPEEAGKQFDVTRFDVFLNGRPQGRVQWDLLGEHNRMNALAAIAAARHAGVEPARAIAALADFKNVKRRMEVRGSAGGVTVYDDFAHHPTAIATTIAGLRAKVGGARILAVLEPRSNTMKLGVMKAALPGSLTNADLVFGYGAGEGKDALGWNLAEALQPLGAKAGAYDALGPLVTAVSAAARSGDHIVVMSNGGFGGVHQKLLDALAAR